MLRRPVGPAVMSGRAALDRLGPVMNGCRSCCTRLGACARWDRPRRVLARACGAEQDRERGERREHAGCACQPQPATDPAQPAPAGAFGHVRSARGEGLISCRGLRIVLRRRLERGRERALRALEAKLDRVATQAPVKVRVQFGTRRRGQRIAVTCGDSRRGCTAFLPAHGRGQSAPGIGRTCVIGRGLARQRKQFFRGCARAIGDRVDAREDRLGRLGAQAGVEQLVAVGADGVLEPLGIERGELGRRKRVARGGRRRFRQPRRLLGRLIRRRGRSGRASRSASCVAPSGSHLAAC